MFKAKKTRVVALAGAGLVMVAAAAAAGGAALAAPAATQVTAPYAQASAVVNADGSLARSKGIAGVTIPSAGRFCVQLADSRLNASELTPVATNAWGAYPSGPLFIESGPTAECGNKTDTILVVTTTREGGGSNKPFHLLVP